MILTEQMYKNLYRPYYRGQRYLETSCFTALLGAPHAFVLSARSLFAFKD